MFNAFSFELAKEHLLPFQIHDADTSEDQSGSSNYKSLSDWKPLERCAALCNRAEFKPGQSGVPVLKREVNGENSDHFFLLDIIHGLSA